MISPGTIRAMAKMRQGVNPDAALSEGANHDLYLADRRSQIFAIRNQEKQATDAARTSTTFNPNPVAAPTSAVSMTNMGPVGPGITNTGVPKSLSDISFGPKPVAPPQPTRIATPEQIKFGTTKQVAPQPQGIKPSTVPTSVAGMSLATVPSTVASTYVPASRLEEFAITTEKTIASLTKEALYKGTDDFKKLFDPNLPIEAGLAKLLDNSNLSVQELNLKTQRDFLNSQEPFMSLAQKAQAKEQRTLLEQQRPKSLYGEYYQASNSFFNANTPEGLRNGYEKLEKQIKNSITSLNNATKGAGAIDGTSIANKQKQLTQALGQLQNVYTERLSQIKADNQFSMFFNEYSNSKDKKEFIKSLEEQGKNSILGLSSFGKNDELELRDLHPFLSLRDKGQRLKPLVKGNIEDLMTTGGDAAAFEYTMEVLQAIRTGQIKEEALVQDIRFKAGRDKIIEAHATTGRSYYRALYNENVKLGHEQESIIKQINKGNLSKEEKETLQQRYNQNLAKFKDLDELGKVIGNVYSPEVLKTNKELRMIAGADIDRIIASEELSKKYSKYGYWSKESFFDWRLNPISRAALYLQEGIMTASSGVIGAFVDPFTSPTAPGLGSARRKSQIEYLYKPIDLVDYNNLDKNGNPVSETQTFYDTKDGGMGFQLRGLLLGAVQMTPQTIMMAHGGRGLAGLGGKAIVSASARNLLNNKFAQSVATSYAQTGSYSAALTRTMAASESAVVRFMANRAPNMLSMAPPVYNNIYTDTYFDLYKRGVKDASSRAHAVASLSTLFETAAENFFPDMKYLDDFAEKGLFGGKWRGTPSQRNILYREVYGKTLSPRAIDYLTAMSLKRAGQVGAAGRFMIARGAEEGLEEVSVELMNAAFGSTLSELKDEPRKELTITDVLNAFASGFVGPPIGIGRQVKTYTEDRRLRSLYDIALNPEYYQNKIIQAQKSGELGNDQAATALTKIAELTSKLEPYRVGNLRKISDKKSGLVVQDMFADPELQFDYFKKTLQKADIDKKLAEADASKLSQKEKEELFAAAQENTKSINEYKRRVSIYESLTEEEKNDIVQNTIKNKVRLSRLIDDNTLDEAIQETDVQLASAHASKQPDNKLQYLRDYRDALAELKNQRTEAKNEAQQSGANIIIEGITSTTPVSVNNTVPGSMQELTQGLAQALVNPNTREDVYNTLSGDFDKEISAIEEDTAKVVEEFIAQVNANYRTETGTTPVFDENGNIIDTVPSVDAPKLNKATSIEDLTESEREELEDLIDELSERRQNLIERKEKVEGIVTTLINNAVQNGTISLEESENVGRDTMFLYQALMNLIKADATTGQNLLYSPAKLAEFIQQNAKEVQAEVDKISKKYNDAVEAQKQAEKEAELAQLSEEERAKKADQEREQVTLTSETAGTESTAAETKKAEEVAAQVEAALPVTGEVETIVTELPPIIAEPVVQVTVPELIPGDVTPEFQQAIETLSQTPAVIEEEVENKITGDIEVVTTENPERARLTKQVLGDIVSSPTINSAKAKMAALMTALGSTEQEIADTLVQMDKLANNQAMLEEEYSHMFNILSLTPGFDNLKGIADTTSVQELGLVEEAAPTEVSEIDAEIAKLEEERKQELIVGTKAVWDTGEYKGKEYNSWIEVEEEINAKYNAEIAKLRKQQEEKAVAEVAVETPTVTAPTALTTPTVSVVKEEDRGKVEDNTKVSRTTELFESKEPAFFKAQSAIFNSVAADFRNTRVALVDMFTLIEEVLGPEVMTEFERIFNEVTSTTRPSTERMNELRNQFMNLFPEGFMKKSAIAYIFDKQMKENLSVSDVDAKEKVKEDYTVEELFEENKQRKVTVTKKDGRVHQDVKVASVDSNGQLLAVNESIPKGEPGHWVVINLAEDKVEGLKMPMVGTRKININDLNTIVFTALDKDGNVQKFTSSGTKSSEGKNAVLFYLPTSKGKANPTETEKMFNGMRQSVANGQRIKQETKLVTKPVPNMEIVGGESRVRSLQYDFTNSEMAPVVSVPTAVDTKPASMSPLVNSLSNRPTPISQQDTIDKLNKLAEDSKPIPDPDKVGYSINNGKWMRQSKLVAMLLGKKEPEDKTLMERGAAVGNLLDSMGRDILGGYEVKTREEYLQEAYDTSVKAKLNNGKGYKLNMEEEAFQALVTELTELKNELESKGWKLFTQGLIVYRKFSDAQKKVAGFEEFEGVAGAMDIVAVDPEGKAHVIDLKNKALNSTVDKFTNSLYSPTSLGGSTVSKWATQQTVYGIITEDFGIPVASINAFAFASNYFTAGETEGEIEISYMTMAKNKTATPAKHKSPISSGVVKLTFDANIMNKVDAITVSSRMAEAPTAPVTPPTTPAPVSASNIKPEFRGKFIYSTPGSGKTTISKTDPNVVDTDDLMVEEMNKRHPKFKQNPGEPIQDFIYRYVKKYDHKKEINQIVLKQVKEAVAQGKTVLTGTLAFIKEADFVFRMNPENSRAISRFGTIEKAKEFAELEKQTVADEKKKAVETKGIEQDILSTIQAAPVAPASTPATTDAKAAFDSAIDKINKSLGNKTLIGIYENSPGIIFEFDGREPSSVSFLTEPITKEGTLYRIKTSRYNVLIDEAFNIKQVVSDKGKVYTVKKNELSRVDIQSPLFNQPKTTVVSTETKSDTETKKADIERRRKAEIDSLESYRNGNNDIWYRTPDGKDKGPYLELENKINAKYDAELARELYKEMKAGKMVTEMTPAEQQVADKYITPELRASVDAELAALEGAKPEVDLSNLSENLPNVNESNAQNAADILSSLGIDVTGQIGLNFPNANDTDTDITNKKCKE